MNTRLNEYQKRVLQILYHHFLHCFFLRLFFETIPVLNPAKSNLSFLYIPGISAVSPPIRSQPANLQPFKIPLKIFLILKILFFLLQCNPKRKEV